MGRSTRARRASDCGMADRAAGSSGGLRGLTLAEGRGWLDEALPRPVGVARASCARALHAAGSLATRQGDYESAAATCSRRAWPSGRSSDDAARDGALAALAGHRSRRSRAIRSARSSSPSARPQLYDESGDQRGQRARDQQPRRDRTRARRVCEGGVRRASRRTGSSRRSRTCRRGMACRARQPGCSRRCRRSSTTARSSLLRQALRRLAELEFRDVIGYCFEGLAAGARVHRARAEEAARLLGAAEVAAREPRCRARAGGADHP